MEIATDKVDSEVPSEVSGVLVEKLFNVDDVVQVGQTIAVIETEAEVSVSTQAVETVVPEAVTAVEETVVKAQETVGATMGVTEDFSASERFYSPLVKNIAKQEGISLAELEAIVGTGNEGRVTKNDILAYVANRATKNTQSAPVSATSAEQP